MLSNNAQPRGQTGPSLAQQQQQQHQQPVGHQQPPREFSLAPLGAPFADNTSSSLVIAHQHALLRNNSNSTNPNIIMIWRHLILKFFIFDFSPRNNNQRAARNRTLHAQTADFCPQSLAPFAQHNSRSWSQASKSNPSTQHLCAHQHNHASLRARL